MTGHQFFQKIHTNVQRAEPVYIRAVQGHSGKNLDIMTFSYAISVQYCILKK